MKSPFLALFALGLAACGAAGSGDTVTFGAAGPWTEGYGLMNRRGAELAVEEINAQRMLGARRLVLRAVDDEGDPSKATQIAADFVADPAIVAVVGHVNSGTMMEAGRVYHGHLPAVATSASSPDLTGLSPWVFRVISSDSATGASIARFAAARQRRRAAILYENDAYGRAFTDVFRRTFTGEVVTMDPISGDDQDLEPFVTYYKQMNVDVVFVAGTEKSGIAFLQEARRQGLAADLIGGDGWTGILADPASAGAFVAAPFTASDPRPEAQRFVAAFKRKFGMEPDGNAALAYDATTVLARGVAAVGADRAKVRDYLAGLRETTPVAGVTGPLAFREDGDPLAKQVAMTRVRDGKLIVEGAQ